MDDQQVKFNVFNTLKYHDEFESCQMLEDITYKGIKSMNAKSKHEETVEEDD